MLIQCSSAGRDKVEVSPGVTELTWGLGAAGYLSSSRSVGGNSEHGAADVDLCAGSACWTEGQGLAVTRCLRRHAIPGQILCHGEE